MRGQRLPYQYGAGSYLPVSTGPPRGLIVPGRPPSPVVVAVWLLFVRAGLGVFTTVVTLAGRSAFKADLLKQDPTISGARLDSLTNAVVLIVVVVATIGVVISVVLAFQVRKGRNWARIVVIVLEALGILAGVASIAQTMPALSHALSLLGALFDATLITLLTQPRSNRYFSTGW